MFVIQGRQNLLPAFRFGHTSRRFLQNWCNVTAANEIARVSVCDHRLGRDIALFLQLLKWRTCLVQRARSTTVRKPEICRIFLTAVEESPQFTGGAWDEFPLIAKPFSDRLSNFRFMVIRAAIAKTLRTFRAPKCLAALDDQTGVTLRSAERRAAFHPVTATTAGSDRGCSRRDRSRWAGRRVRPSSTVDMYSSESDAAPCFLRTT